MDEIARRAIVWDIIERLAFQPKSESDQRTWLGVYAKTLHKFWGLEPMWQNFSSSHIFDIPFLGMKCGYNIESMEKYSISLMDLSENGNYWQSHIDPGYISKASLHSVTDRYPNPQKGCLQRDVEAVLDGMLFHPRCHSHIEDIGAQNIQLDLDSGGLSSHEVRIGGGVENPYIFLFHLRYQCCLVADLIRKDEKQRLIDLFCDSIRDRFQSVSARDLCNFKRN